jgi:hypothetical protein
MGEILGQLIVILDTKNLSELQQPMKLNPPAKSNTKVRPACRQAAHDVTSDRLVVDTIQPQRRSVFIARGHIVVLDGVICTILHEGGEFDILWLVHECGKRSRGCRWDLETPRFWRTAPLEAHTLLCHRQKTATQFGDSFVSPVADGSVENANETDADPEAATLAVVFVFNCLRANLASSSFIRFFFSSCL